MVEPEVGESKKWQDMKGRYSGERVFLVGNGPSLNKTPLYLLKDEYVMCFNRFGLMSDRLNWTPEFFMVSDNLVLEDLIDKAEIHDLVTSAKWSFFPDIHFRGNLFRRQIGDHKNIRWIRQRHGTGFSVDLPTAYLGGSVIYEGFQVLAYLGFKQIVFVGVDMNFKPHKTVKTLKFGETDIKAEADDDPNHFDPRYFGTGRKYHQPEDYVVQAILDSLFYLSSNQSKLGLDIVNAGIDSRVSAFPTTTFDSLFSFDENEVESLVDACFIQNTNYASCKAFLKDSHFIDQPDMVDYALNFHTNTETGLGLIASSILTHIPIGPHKNTYYFVKRV